MSIIGLDLILGIAVEPILCIETKLSFNIGIISFFHSHKFEDNFYYNLLL